MTASHMQVFVPLVEGLARMFGPDCEVVLHDLAQIPQSIVAIENGHVTGRDLGDPPTDQMLRSLRHADEGTPNVRVYLSSHEGKILKSLAVTLRDGDGRPLGILGVNLDVSEVVRAQRVLTAFTSAAPQPGDAAPHTEEIFAADIREVVSGMIAGILNEMGKTPALMSRDEKMEVVRRLEDRGAFLVKRSAEQVADALDLSRFTIFSYLKEIRHGVAAPAGGAGDGATAPAGGGGDGAEAAQ